MESKFFCTDKATAVPKTLQPDLDQDIHKGHQHFISTFKA